ncbi:MAG: Regulatory protein LuxO [Paracidovorax wautersii]|uniref:Regulatory protein LuxO n=1 Tax=Paracidovorax wautersii TaxID=1177982 RepID=A0A7V8FL75_9BURK|nr:MAG: Regulatory protein LuxO [Paracidovorax wautersii]
MTHHRPLLDALVPLVDDLARELDADERYRRLLDAMARLVDCDAAALLRLDGDVLVPMAVRGLSPDTLGRRFRVAEQPRLRALLAADGATLFPPDCAWPDPYDGLVVGEGGPLPVHDCMGCALRVGTSTWGLLTLDALQARRFSDADLRVLEAFASLAAATVTVAARIDQLAISVQDERQRAEAFRLAAAGGRGRELLGASAVWRRMRGEIDLVAPSA